MHVCVRVCVHECGCSRMHKCMYVRECRLEDTVMCHPQEYVFSPPTGLEWLTDEPKDLPCHWIPCSQHHTQNVHVGSGFQTQSLKLTTNFSCPQRILEQKFTITCFQSCIQNSSPKNFLDSYCYRASGSSLNSHCQTHHTAEQQALPLCVRRCFTVRDHYTPLRT